ncbi:MAG: flavin reductase [Spirochaetales bacterium]|nr:flavin reductase [Spirochaetales bacterium]
MIDLNEVFKDYHLTAERMAGKGVLLVTGKAGNPMTIGWGQLGIIWGRPVFTVMVRPSRFSYDTIRKGGEFTVNVMPEDSGKILAVCGSKSGRDTNKLEKCGLNLLPSEMIETPGLMEAEIVYECRTRHVNDLVPSTLPVEIINRYYPQDDFHSFYFGEVINVRRKV